MISGLTQGFSSIEAANVSGAKYEARLRNVIGNSIFLLSQACFLTAGHILLEPVLRLLKIPPETLPLSWLSWERLYINVFVQDPPLRNKIGYADIDSHNPADLYR